jgi:hypothetical protein
VDRELKGDDVVHGVCSLPIGKARVKPHPCQPPAPTTQRQVRPAGLTGELTWQHTGFTDMAG